MVVAVVVLVVDVRVASEVDVVMSTAQFPSEFFEAINLPGVVL